MSDWYGHARSNYFRVRDKEKFCAWAEELNLEVQEDDQGRVALLSNAEFGGWPFNRYDEETDDCEEIDIYGEVSEHLQDGSVAVLIEVGAEKLCYLTGLATAVNSKGDTVEVSLHEIYERAKSLEGEITDASY